MNDTTKRKSSKIPQSSASKPKRERVVVEDMSSVYGDSGPLTMEGPNGLRNMKSSDIGSGFIAITMTESEKKQAANRKAELDPDPIPDRESSYDQQSHEYDSKFWVVKRHYNRNYLSRSKDRLIKSLKRKYDSEKGLILQLSSQDTLQATKTSKEMEEEVRSKFQVVQTSLETFLLQEVLPKSLAYQSAIDRATNVAKVIADDTELTLDTQHIRLAHTDALSLSGIIQFFTAAKIPKNILDHYMMAFITNKFHRS